MAPLHRKSGRGLAETRHLENQKDKAVGKSHRFLIIVAVSTPIHLAEGKPIKKKKKKKKKKNFFF